MEDNWTNNISQRNVNLKLTQILVELNRVLNNSCVQVLADCFCEANSSLILYFDEQSFALFCRRMQIRGLDEQAGPDLGEFSTRKTQRIKVHVDSGGT